MGDQAEALLKQLRDGGYGASGYVTSLIETLCREVLSPNHDIEVTRRFARRVQAMMPAFKRGLAVRLYRTDIEQP